MSRPAIIVMAKAPRPGESKTRLAPPLTLEEAAGLAASFFADTLSLARRAAAGGAVVVAYAPADGRAALERLAAGAELLWLEQEGDCLGARLSSAAGRASSMGLGPLLFVGADSPTLPPRHLTAALDALSAGHADVALGPAEDGGYYAVGMRAPTPSLFDSVEWSTPRAYAQTARNAARLGLRLLELPRWYDVDTPADLRRLRRELSDDEEARRRAPSTYAWLRAHFG